MKICPVCSAKFTLPFWFLRGSRTKTRALVHFCLRCGFIFQRTSYHEDDLQLESDLGWHLGKFDSQLIHSSQLIARFLNP